MTFKELQERQKWSLSQKIDHSLGVIDQFYNRLDGRVYVSLSGGKDSTVVLWLARKIFPDIKAVFCNTGNEFPDIVKFVRDMKNRGENVEIIYPKLKPKEMFAKYGFPLVSKETSERIHRLRTNPNSYSSKRARGEIKTSFRATIPSKWKFLVTETFETSNQCCDKLKKGPFHRFEKEQKLAPILGTMADESNLRTAIYVNRGGV